MTIGAIREVLDRAGDGGRQIQFWWRDDDAVAATPALDRLLAIAGSAQVPIAIATIPARAEPSLSARLAEHPGARILVHGLSHANHSGPGRKSAEFGDDRPLDVMSAEAGHALARARAMAGGLLLPVFVPPWNRIGETLPPALPCIGYAGLSTFGPTRRTAAFPVVNTHLDPVAWRGSRSAVEPEILAAALERAVSDPATGPVGLLTHHLMFDDALWRITNVLLECLVTHPVVRFPRLDTLWGGELRHCTVTRLMT